MQSLKYLILLFFLVLSSGCGNTPIKTSGDGPLDLTPEELTAYLEKAETLEAAEKYKRKLLATEFLIKQAEISRAQSVVNQIPLSYGDSNFLIRQMLARGQIAVREGEPYLAQRYLFNDSITPELISLEPEIATVFLDTGATLLYDLGDYLKAFERRVQLGELLESDELRKQFNHDLIWESLAEIPTDTLFELSKTEQDATKQGWLSLAALSKSNGANYRKQIDDINHWKQIWPAHPANSALPADLQLILQLVDQQEIDIAVILPLSGKLSSAGKSIREGILAAYYDDASTSPVLPNLEFHDSVNRDINALYDQVMAEGAQLVIGPLLKQNVEALSSRESLPIPVLALNSVTSDLPEQTQEGEVDFQAERGDSVSHDQLFQFSMAVENEAAQVAEKAWRDGQRRALIIAPAGSWGNRSVASFKAAWLDAGGQILDERRFSDQRSYSSLIESSVGVNQSKNRKARLQSILLRQLEFEPRSRKDIDFIFLPSYSHQAKLLKPLLAFHYAGSIPVYSMSQVYNGRNTENLSDLNGIRFATLPWYFEEKNLERRSIEAYGDNNPSLQPFYAMGVDAYHIYPRLEQLKLIEQASFYGQTGKLNVGSGNVIQREQSWAEIRKGVAVEITNELDVGEVSQQ